MAENTELTGRQKVQAAYDVFDTWLAEQSDDVQDMNLLEQIEVYAKDMA